MDVAEKFKLLSDYWSPGIAEAVNDSYTKLVKVKGELVWRNHMEGDEFFFVVKGRLTIKSRDRDVDLREGEFVIILGVFGTSCS